MFWISLFLKAFLALLAVLIGIFVGLPLILAEVTRQRNRLRKDTTSSLYVGRVWHTRLIPKKHAFNYPLFVFALDLEEVEDLFTTQLWPLSLIVDFRNIDHLKNDEGLLGENGNGNDKPEQHAIAKRVIRLVAQKTKHQFQPTLQTHRVLIVTHLCYYGYCFNPVSFYYLQDKATDKLSVVVAEVSNTPWNEMHCYVLHKNSTDDVQVKEVNENTINYKFPKKFHVSPFMEMDYLYDWTFHNFVLESQKEDVGKNDASLKASASMKRDTKIHFTAKMEVFRKGIHPYTIAWQLISYPVYCFIIQLWIHYEAFWLFVKGIVFVPHPNDAETAVSRVIAAVMTPIFAFKDWLAQIRSGGVGMSTETSTSDDKSSKIFYEKDKTS